MNGTQNNIVELICHSLAMSTGAPGVKCIPTLLIDRPDRLQSWRSTDVGTSADLALAYYHHHGFLAGRTRKDLFGYPAFLRNLSNPPPWIQVQPDQVDRYTDRADDLRPLILHAQEQTVESLVSRYRSEHQQYKVPSVIIEALANSFRNLVGLGKVLGMEFFENICDAVFGFDEFTVAAGAPDLLVWLAREESSCWFFSEVKAPGDYLLPSQKRWLHQHWDLLCGHFLLTVLE